MPKLLSGYFRNQCPDAAVTLSGCFRNGCPDKAEIRKDPMAIKEFSFEVNITADTEFKSETEISLNIWRLSLKEKLTYDYKQHFGITVKATLVPVYTLND